MCHLSIWTCDLSTYQDAIYATREQLGMFPKQLHGRMLASDLALYFSLPIAFLTFLSLSLVCRGLGFHSDFQHPTGKACSALDLDGIPHSSGSSVAFSLGKMP